MSDSSESDDGPGNWSRHRRGSGKNKRKIVMRIEFDDSEEDTSSGSDSNGEESIKPSTSGCRTNGGGKRLFLSDNENDSSSGSEIARTVVVRGRNKRKAVIVEEEPAADEPQTDTATQNIPSSSGVVAQQPSAAEDGFASDSSNDDLEKCPICLLSLRNQEIGKPSVCDHLFCAICIEEWSRNVRTCPIDRQPFESIVVQESINNRKFIREIKVNENDNSKENFEEEEGEYDAVQDVENCQICHRPDREDIMLLCDGCNHGYHMDCLNPPLVQIPEGFWYCDNCFESEEEVMQEEINELYEELRREIGIAETRLRIREVRQPRIPRTRQSERIRATIAARTRRSNTRITSEMDFVQPSTSSRGTTATRSANTRRGQVRKRRTRRRTGRQRRTYVVEYDVDNFDQKFQIKTTKKIVRKRKSGKKSSRRKRRKTAARATGTHKRNTEINDFLALRTARVNSSGLPQPRFSLFGAANDLEYFSDDSENSIVGGDSETGRGAGGGASIQTSIRIQSFASGRSLARRKGIIRELDQPREADILSSILDMQDRFHNATRQNHISQVTIGPNGTLNIPGKKESGNDKRKIEVPPGDVNQAPMYPRGGGNSYNNSGGNNSGGGGGGGYNNRFNNQSNHRHSTGGGGQFRGGSFGSSNAGNTGGFLFNAFRRDNNNFQSDNSFQQNRINNTDNSSPNRGRFRQNQQQRRNQNNQNRYSGPPSRSGGNDSLNCSFDGMQNTNTFGNNINTSIMPPAPLFGLGPPPLFPPPTKPTPSDSGVKDQSAPINYSMTNNLSGSNMNLITVPMHQPPPLILPVYGPMNITGPDPMPTPEINNAPNEPPATSIFPPLAPPPWNQNLFRLTSDYADDDDDDSNCPNFSVYSAESFQVARSSENALDTTNTVADFSQNSKVDDENVRQEDEYEEKEEDLVQLGDDDDDDIADELEQRNATSNINENNADNQRKTITSESEMYEPEFPTAEPIDENDNDGADASANNEKVAEEVMGKSTPEKKNDERNRTEEEKMVESPTSSKIEAENVQKEDDEDSDTGTIPLPDTAPSTKSQDSSEKKGILELYDDSDWDEWNIDKTEFIPMPPEPQKKDSSSSGETTPEKEHHVENDRINSETDVNINSNRNKSPPSSRNDDYSRTPEKESLTPEKEKKVSGENENLVHEESWHSRDEGGTPELDDEKLRQLASKKPSDTYSEEDEQERSYTPCLDEKTEHDEAHSDLRDGLILRSEEGDKADDCRGDVSTSVVDGMEMELISEEDEDMLNEEQSRANQNKADERGKKDDDSGGKRSRREQFKKISKNTKGRNYRDKENRVRPKKRSTWSLSRSRSRSRSHSKGKENKNRPRAWGRRGKRKEIERYNVRNVIGQPRTYKDRYGRDTSRPARSRSRSRSPSFRRQRTVSRSRSPSQRNDRRSFSMSPTPVSINRASPRRFVNRRSSPLPRRMSSRRRGYSPKRSKSRSRQRSRSVRRSSLPRRRSRSPIRLRPRSRSFSLGRSKKGRNQRVRRRVLSHSCSRSRSCSRSLSRRKSKSHSPMLRSPQRSRSRSRSPIRIKNKGKRSKERRKKRNKKRLLSKSASPPPEKRDALSPEHSLNVRKKKKRARSKSPVIDNDRWSQTPELALDTALAPSQPNDSSWTPPLIGANSDNLTVILKNKDAAVNGTSKKRRDKKKRSEKRREGGRKEKRRQRSEMRESPPAPSKEVFASGNNILVSVSFNKDNNLVPPQQTTVVTLPPTREEIISKRRSAERQGRKQKRFKEKSQRRRKKLDTKPVAIIDLERSPFQVIAQSPRDVIILTDESDRERDEEENDKRKSNNSSMEMGPNDRVGDEMQLDGIDKAVDMQRLNPMEAEEPFELQQLGPKTPPDPPSIKFALTKSLQIKSRNALHDSQEELEEPTDADQADDQMSIHTNNKIGPNTPPDFGPCSPDAYDPFDPTKSPSVSPSSSPAPVQDTAPEDSTEKTTHIQEPIVEPRPTAITQEKNINPVELVMALISTKSAMTQQEMHLNSDPGGYTMPMKVDSAEGMNNVTSGDENICGKNITVLSNVLIASNKGQNRTNQMLNTSPPMSKLPLVKQSTSISRQNGGAASDDIGVGTGGLNDPESPYSPGSGDYEDLFEPPPSTADNSITLAQLARKRKANKADMFDNLFGSTSPADQVRMPNFARHKSGNKPSARKTVKVAKTKLEDDQIKIFDELPSSAVELQVKDKFLRKLNRQERVVEEVKLVLKPHYNRKRITKDDYKEILRRAVPKICHSRSGEINPAKIKNLIEAYVKKFRQRNKLNIIGTGQVSSAVKCAAYLKKL